MYTREDMARAWSEGYGVGKGDGMKGVKTGRMFANPYRADQPAATETHQLAETAPQGAPGIDPLPSPHPIVDVRMAPQGAPRRVLWDPPCARCRTAEGSSIHQLGNPHYHPFTSEVVR